CYVTKFIYSFLDGRNQGMKIRIVSQPLAITPEKSFIAQPFSEPCTIQPGQFLKIKDWPSQGDSRDIKMLKHLLQGKFLTLIGHRPAHAGKIIQQSLWQEARLAIIIDGCGILAFA